MYYCYYGAPLEQFTISVVFPIFYLWFDLSITSFATVVLSFLILFKILKSGCVGSFRRPFNKSNFEFFIRNFYFFIFNTVFQQAGLNGIKFISFAFTVFSIIFFSNFWGLSVIGATLTAQLIVPVVLGFSINLGTFLLGLNIHGFRFFKFFVPSGVPFLILPFIVLIEVFSYLIRPISMSVRLFANLMAGHTLMHIIASFFVSLAFSFDVFMPIVGFFTVILLVAIFCLEIVVSFLQAYVFLTLFCIYLNDALIGGDHL